MIYSPDQGMTWTPLANSGQQIHGVAGDGVNVWGSNAFPYNPDQRPAAYLPYYQAKESDPMNWSSLASPMMTSGGVLAYDADHKLLYSANYWEGIWRVVVE